MVSSSFFALLSMWYLYKKPQDYTPALQFLFSIIFFLIAYWIGYSKDIENAKRAANDRWLPQAESVILRLITLKAEVRRFAHTVNCNINRNSEDLPELAKDENKAIRIKMKADCEANTEKLKSVANQLEDAIEDWRRFIIDNCNGDECSRIFDAIRQREETSSSE